MSAPDVTVLVNVADQFEGLVDHELLSRSVRVGVQVAMGDASHPHGDDEHRTWRHTEVSVRVTNDEEMHRLNVEYRGVDRPTDVLSFSFVSESEGSRAPFPPGWPWQLGEIVLSYSYAARQADELGHSLEHELAWLTIHGTLQLLGYRHHSDEEAEHMEALEQAALGELGFSSE